MKKILLLIILLLCMTTVRAQVSVTIIEVPNINTVFHQPIRNKKLILIDDSAAIYQLTAKMDSGRTMAYVFSHGTCVRLTNVVTPKIKLTPEGGYAMQLTAGETLAQGDVVTIGSSDNAVVKINKSLQEPIIGVVYYAASVSDPVWVVVSGRALTRFSTGIYPPVRGYFAVITASSTNGQMTSEISFYQSESILGVVLETKTAGSLTYVMVNPQYGHEGPP